MKLCMTCVVLFAASAAIQADEAGAIRAFEKAKRTDPELMVFLKKMPKGGDLHNHVSGAVYSDYMMDAAIKKGMTFDPATSQFGTDPSKPPGKDLLTNNDLLYNFLNATSMRGWMGGGQSGHDHFFATFGMFGSAYGAMSPVDILAEVVGRAKAQHEVYMELMGSIAPGSAWSAYSQNLPSSADMTEALHTLLPRLQKLHEASKSYLYDVDQKLAARLGQRSVESPTQPITIRYVASVNRLASPDSFFASAAAGMYLAAREPRIVAMNILAPEDHPNARTNFDLQMKQLDFLWRHLGRPNLTLHAGELTPAISPIETMRDRIRKTIEIGHAKRIGHGVDIAWEDDAEGLMAKMKREGIAVEICLTSNYSILGVSGQQHPFWLYRSHGVPVFLNTDDEGVSRSTMTLEYIRAVREQHVGYKDLKEMARNSIEYSFLPGRSLFRNRNVGAVLPQFEGYRRRNWKPSPAAQKLLDTSPKMEVQLRLERALATFEAQYH